MEVLKDEKAVTAAGFTQRAITWFASHGITVQAVMTDNGSCYISHLYRDTLEANGVTHVRIPPRQPQINGKVERFNRTLLDEWVYVASIGQKTNASTLLPIGSTATTITATTPPSAAHPSAAQPTWLLITPSPAVV